MTFKLDPSLGLAVFVDADFTGNWDSKDTENPDTTRNRHGYIIRYLGCPTSWKSQLQQEICQSSTNSEYAGLSCALCEVKWSIIGSVSPSPKLKSTAKSLRTTAELSKCPHPQVSSSNQAPQCQATSLPFVCQLELHLHPRDRIGQATRGLPDKASQCSSLPLSLTTSSEMVVSTAKARGSVR